MKANLFIVGVAKGGTTSIHSLLNQHPQIQMSDPKEPHFFSGLNSSIGGIEKYEKLFLDRTVKYYGDASTSYFWKKNIAKHIFRYNKDAKIIISLREPVSRAFSHFNMDVYSRREKELKFSKALQNDLNDRRNIWDVSRLYHQLGLYNEATKEFIDTFDTDQVKIIFFEELIKEPSRVISDLQRFLNLDNIDLKLPIENVTPKDSYLLNRIKSISGNYRVPNFLKDIIRKQSFLQHDGTPDIESVNYLLAYYRNDQIQLSETLNTDFYLNLILEKYNKRLI